MVVSERLGIFGHTLDHLPRLKLSLVLSPKTHSADQPSSVGIFQRRMPSASLACSGSFLWVILHSILWCLVRRVGSICAYLDPPCFPAASGSLVLLMVSIRCRESHAGSVLATRRSTPHPAFHNLVRLQRRHSTWRQSQAARSDCVPQAVQFELPFFLRCMGLPIIWVLIVLRPKSTPQEKSSHPS